MRSAIFSKAGRRCRSSASERLKFFAHVCSRIADDPLLRSRLPRQLLQGREDLFDLALVLVGRRAVGDKAFDILPR